ncbi:MAG: SDR family oxidoreductase [Alphaproteobacteria bacterium]|jgi:NAD(P)-dependent dehydrogenase (short-subunit alcohol dehydrogenase family)|nr:SDR family oxidoreductase [Rhodospirillaceae bacterium]MBT6511649.1 SDR family oxidoreductase [Rhodospirillaceae bacterium]MBT7613874.1 SDR family oxidoreductase [Rhodospirillaceae bacterium]MBT7645650.1 SDR family oxidoreductase [Rhodospirillaceae bacterium]MDG2479790.1 SDR family oxidoreductase [Alphaproteobacteria bacterium]
MSLFDLAGQVAVVTGGSKGIGRAICERMAEAGARVVVSSRKIDACEEVVAGIKAKGGEAMAVACNVTHIDQLQHLVDESIKAYGKIDCLVGNAAVNPHYGPMTTIEESAFEKIMNCNIRANLWLSRMVLPQMAERKEGSIILISSIAGIKGTDDIGVYGISKAADMAMARNLAVRWGEHNIRVNTIAPGLIRTDFAKALWEDPEKLASVEAQYPLRRIGEPDDIAGVAILLAADAGRYITGQTIVVDGGSTIAVNGI